MELNGSKVMHLLNNVNNGFPKQNDETAGILEQLIVQLILPPL
jgi:hypothetical protein